MTDDHDPFAERPYTPPADRGPDAEQPTTPEGPTDVAGESPVTPAADTAQQPTEQPGAPTPPAAPAPQPPAAAAPPAPEVPAAAAPPEPQQPAAPVQPAAYTPGQPLTPPAAAESHVDPTLTHRYEPPADSAAAAAATTQIPHLEQAGDGTPPQQPPRARRRGGRLAAAALAMVLLGAAGGAGGAAIYNGLNDDDQAPVSSLTGDSSSKNTPAGDVERVAQSVLPSVVQINVRGQAESNSGTGIIISSDGDILTNNHVVEAGVDDGQVTVSFNDGTNGKATIVGRDPVTDLAVIKVEGKTDLTPATLGSSSELKVGQEVVAIGSPFGLESTVTSGIISALNRPVESSDGTGANPTVFPAVQTDAAINPGNSGGPLVDLQGRVIAINAAIRSNGTTAATSGSIGLGFAIPVDLAKSVAEQLVDGKTVEHARIGVTVSPAVSEDAITGIGAQIEEVTAGSSGDKAGLKVGDVITSIEGHPTSSSDAVVAAIRNFRPGDKVTVTYSRDGKTATAEVTLDSDGGKAS